MQIATETISLLLITLLAGCASAPKFLSPVPSTAKSEPAAISRSNLLDQTNHMVRHLDKEKNIVYSQSFGGGGAGLGLLLGPLGVAANVKMIEANTEKDSGLLMEKIQIDPVKVFGIAATNVNFAIADTVNNVVTKFSPYLYVIKGQEEKLFIAAAFIVENEAAGQKWIGRYMYQLPVNYSVDTLSKASNDTTGEIEKNLIVGFSELIKMFRDEKAESVPQEKLVLFKSNFMNPRFDFEMHGMVISESSDRVWIRTFNGIYSIIKSNITINTHHP